MGELIPPSIQNSLPNFFFLSGVDRGFGRGLRALAVGLDLFWMKVPAIISASDDNPRIQRASISNTVENFSSDSVAIDTLSSLVLRFPFRPAKFVGYIIVVHLT
jgi:hypothetical protein